LSLLIFNSEDTANSWLYLNNGASNNIDLALETKSFLVDDMLDFGTLSYPSFTDVDQDGLLDIIVGHTGYYEFYNPITFSPDYSSQLAYLRNVGDSNFPAYQLIDRDFNNLSSNSHLGLYPTFGDLDNDGDDDMLCGTLLGDVVYYENVATTGSIAQYNLIDTNFMGINNGSFAAPELYDLNEDGLLDLIIGVRDGTIKYHENIGSLSSAQFSSTPTNDTLSGLEYFNPFKNGFVRMTFGKTDSTNSTYGFVGTQDGNIQIFNEITQNLQKGDVFQKVDSLRTGLQLINIDVANTNFSDSLEWIAGEAPGGISLWGRSSTFIPPPIDSIIDTVGINEIEEQLSFKLYPNPAQNQLFLRFQKEINNEVMVSITDISGRLLAQNKYQNIISGQELSLNIQSINPGIYFISVYNGRNLSTRNVVIY